MQPPRPIFQPLQNAQSQSANSYLVHCICPWVDHSYIDSWVICLLVAIPSLLCLWSSARFLCKGAQILHVLIGCCKCPEAGGLSTARRSSQYHTLGVLESQMQLLNLNQAYMYMHHTRVQVNKISVFSLTVPLHRRRCVIG